MSINSWEWVSYLLLSLIHLLISTIISPFPFYTVEQSTQPELFVILPKLYKDLLEHKTDTLSSFVVNIPGISPPGLTNNLGKEIIQQMCEAATSSVQQQCRREYGFLYKVM